MYFVPPTCSSSLLSAQIRCLNASRAPPTNRDFDVGPQSVEHISQQPLPASETVREGSPVVSSELPPGFGASLPSGGTPNEEVPLDKKEVPSVPSFATMTKTVMMESERHFPALGGGGRGTKPKASQSPAVRGGSGAASSWSSSPSLSSTQKEQSTSSSMESLSTGDAVVVQETKKKGKRAKPTPLFSVGGGGGGRRN